MTLIVLVTQKSHKGDLFCLRDCLYLDLTNDDEDVLEAADLLAREDLSWGL